MRGEGRSPLKVSMIDTWTGFAGGFLTILLLGALTNVTDTLWLMAPFGASCVLAFSVWNAPLSQPRNIIGGHLISSFTGLVAYHWIGDDPWVIGLAVGLSIALMMLTKTTHPPAGADPLVIIIGGYSFSYLLSPVLIGSLLIVAMALVINNLHTARRYPTFWM
ncbi:HPP family protein [Paenibacillus sp. J5C2022]|uniref:HPP family protein n=1 Tax=Paenibacillus sp. J5C2022 TaxID=2977129 RepID=UPI00397BA5C3